MTQHTDMGGLVERLRKRVAIETACGNLTKNPMNHVRLLAEAADAIEALSILQGLGDGWIPIRDTIVHFLDRDESETDYQGLLRRAEDAAKAIVAHSAGPSEEQVERAAKGLFEDWVSEDFDHEYCSWEQLPDKDTWRRRARAALTSARAQ